MEHGVEIPEDPEYRSISRFYFSQQLPPSTFLVVTEGSVDGVPCGIFKEIFISRLQESSSTSTTKMTVSYE